MNILHLFSMFFLVPCVDTYYSFMGDMVLSCPTVVHGFDQDCNKDKELAKACPVTCGICSEGKLVFSANQIEVIRLGNQISPNYKVTSPLENTLKRT